jgi:hypothetical protein
MNARSQTTLIASACLVVSMAASVVVLRRVDRIRPQATLEDVLYVDSPNVVRRASLGYNGLMACIYWTRAVQYFGGRHFDRSASYNQLAPLLEITTNLDPQLTVAYQFGASFLAPNPPGGAGQPDRAIQLMEYGIQHNPNDWHLYYNLGFVYYMDLHNYGKASETFARGAVVPNSHPFMRVLAAQMAQHAGEFGTARMLWSATYEGSQDKQIRQNAIDHLRSLKVDEDVTNLQSTVTRFGERTGRLPASMSELAAAEGLRGIPVDPDRHPYRLTREGRVLVENPDDFAFITKGTPPGYKPAPAKPHDQQ